MSRTSRASVAALLVASVVLTGCSGLSDNEKIAAESLSAAFEQEYGDISVEDADCAGEKWVRDIGLTALQRGKALGENLTVPGNVRDAELTEAGAKRAAAAFQECGDFDKVVTGMVTTLFESTDEQSDCIAGEVTSDAVDDWVVNDLQGKVRDNIYVAAGRECMSTPERDATAVDALTLELAGKDRGLTPEQAGCVARGLVQEIGTYELVAAEILQADLQPSQAPGFTLMNETDASIAADVTVTCVPLEDLLTRGIKGGGTSGDAAELKKCLTAAVDDQAYHRYYVASYMGRQATFGEDAAKKLADCLTPLLETG